VAKHEADYIDRAFFWAQLLAAISALGMLAIFAWLMGWF
jgi:hypothetical protein